MLAIGHVKIVTGHDPGSLTSPSPRRQSNDASNSAPQTAAAPNFCAHGPRSRPVSAGCRIAAAGAWPLTGPPGGCRRRPGLGLGRRRPGPGARAGRASGPNCLAGTGWLPCQDNHAPPGASPPRATVTVAVTRAGGRVPASPWHRHAVTHWPRRRALEPP
jgi:hypothetical protein